VLDGALLLGSIEAALSKTAARQGQELQKEAIGILMRARGHGTLVPIDQIQGIENPLPSMWVSIQGEGTGISIDPQF
jgi:hypothetical protein